MDELSHTILYVDDTNIVGKSSKYNDLYKTINVTLQLISEWFQINQLVLNKNKTFAINFSWAKTPTRTLNLILDNQNLLLQNQLISWVCIQIPICPGHCMENLLKELSTACNLMRNLYYYLIPGSLKRVYF